MHVLIATATMNCSVSTGVLRMFTQAHQRNSLGGKRRFTTMVAENVLGYAHMRNRVAKVFLESPCDVLWFVDQDVMPPDNVFTALDVDADILACGVPYPHCQTGALLYLKNIEDLSSRCTPEADADGVMDAHAVTTACTWIRRRVLEDKRMRWPTTYTRQDGTLMDQKDDPNAAPPIFRYHFKPDGDTEFGEDFDFSYRAAKLGYKVKAHSGIICDHIKTQGILRDSMLAMGGHVATSS